MQNTTTNSNHLFCSYLKHYQLSREQVAKASDVTQGIVWRVEHDKPVLSSSAARVRVGLRKLTGVFYTGPITTTHEGTTKIRGVGLKKEAGR